MLEHLEKLPPDSILGLAAACNADPNPDKINLTVGVYQDDTGATPVFQAIAQAQRDLVAQEKTKVYMAPAGDPAFNTGMQRLVLGATSPVFADGRVGSVQAPGGCGALRIGAELINAARPGARVWVSDPTWPVHRPLLGSVGLRFQTYRYYDPASHGVNADGMFSDLAAATAGDVVLLHGCCHNPCGADLTLEQWRTIAEMAERQGFMVFVDIAYQGLGDGLDADAAGVRLLAERLPELLIAASCSKNMGLYRERTGACIYVSAGRDNTDALTSQALVAARRIYSMPPAHGALLAGRVLSDSVLRADWERELGAMCDRVNRLRAQLVERLYAATGHDFSFIAREKGMFSFLGLSREQVVRLREQHSVYMVESSRINVAGVNATNIEPLCAAVAAVLRE